MADWTSLTYAVADVEGNGQQPPDLVELAVVPITGGIIGEPTSWLIRPDSPISPIATRIHRITNQAVADAPAFATIENEVRQALDADAIVAHNAHVDVGVLRRKLDGWQPPEVFDTLRLARRILSGQDSYRLGRLVENFHLADGLPDLMPHRATYDAVVAARLFVRIATKARTLDNLRDDTGRRRDDGATALF